MKSISKITLIYFLFFAGICSTYSQGIVNNGATIVLNSSSRIYIDGTNGNYLSQNSGLITNVATGAILNLEGNWTNNSANTGFSNSGTTVNFAGTTQAINGSNGTTFTNIETNGTTTIGSQMINITGTLTNTAGSLTTNNNLTLISNSTGTARIAEITGSGISGDVIVQRFIPGGSNSKRRWRFLGSPVNVTDSISLTQIIDDILVTGTGGSANGFENCACNPSLRTYNETLTGDADNGWTAPSTINAKFRTGTGMEVFIRGSRAVADPYLNWSIPDDATIDFIGTINSGPINLNLSFTNNGLTTEDGFNLIANPYPSQIDLQAATGWTKTNITDYVWAYDAVTGAYGTFDMSNGNSVNGITRYVPLGQAFFVKATNSGAVLGFTEAVKVSNTPFNFFKQAKPSQHLKIRFSNDSANVDEAMIVFDNTATIQGNDTKDAGKFFNDRLNIYTVSNDGANLTFNYIPFQKKLDTVKLSAWSFNTTGIMAGKNTLKFSGFESLDSTFGIYLLDLFANTTINIKNDSIYTFEITSDVNSHGNNRFRLVFDGNKLGYENQALNNKNQLLLYPNPVENNLKINIKSINSNVNLPFIIFDKMGRIIDKGHLNFENSIANFSTSNLTSGLYYIQVNDKSGQYSSTFLKN